MAPISAALPLITVGCQCESSSAIMSTLDIWHLPFETRRLKDVAPIATGSKTSGFLLTFASRPATSIPSLSVIVLPISGISMGFGTYPKLINNAPMTGLRSLQSLGFVAMIGLAPTARVALAESLMTTLFVIYCQLPLICERTYLMDQRCLLLHNTHQSHHSFDEIMDLRRGLPRGREYSCCIALPTPRSLERIDDLPQHPR
jgi:hypothetical protein